MFIVFFFLILSMEKVSTTVRLIKENKIKATEKLEMLGLDLSAYINVCVARLVSPEKAEELLVALGKSNDLKDEQKK
jgi:antitoxin component of RelBE/YafQ-DinJ toxin-antitoxin module